MESTFSVLLEHGARDLDAYRPALAGEPFGWRHARQQLAAHAGLLGLADLHLIGEGASGWVFSAWQAGLARRVAVKVGKQRGAPTDDLVRHQAEAMAALDHPGVPSVHGCGRLPDGRTFLVAEWIAGTTLAQTLLAGPLPASRLVTVAIQVARTLAHAHARGCVHGDVQPANILLPQDPARPAVLLDWHGRADSTAAGSFVSLGYVRPERDLAVARLPEASDDVWALAMTLRQAMPEPPAALRGVLARALAARPTSRLATARALLAALEQTAAGPGEQQSGAEETG